MSFFEIDGLSNSRIRHFLLEEKIGEGAFSQVFKAVDEKLGRQVAIKVLKNEVGNEDVIRRFERESVVASRIDHTNVVRVLESGVSENRYFIVFELVEGVSLREWLHFTQPNHETICRLLINVVRGLASAHEIGIVHRDLKPENIIVNLSGVPKVTDFGLASLPENHFTMGDISIGTVAYMSPEQAAGKSNKATPRSDIFSVGVVLFEAITHTFPIQAATHAEYVASLASQQVMPIREYDRSVHIDLGAIVDKCLTLDPSYRYSDASELCVDLENFVEGKPTKARPLSSAAKTWRHIHRNSIAYGLLCIFVVSLCTTTGIALFYAAQSHKNYELQQVTADIAVQTVANAISSSKTEKLNDTIVHSQPIKEKITAKLALLERKHGEKKPVLFNVLYAGLSLGGFSKEKFNKILSALETLSDVEFAIFLELSCTFPVTEVENSVSRCLKRANIGTRLRLVSFVAGTGESGIEAVHCKENQELRFKLIDEMSKLESFPELAKKLLTIDDFELQACVVSSLAEWSKIKDKELLGRIRLYSNSENGTLRSAAHYAASKHRLISYDKLPSVLDANGLVYLRTQNNKLLGVSPTELTLHDLKTIASHPDIRKILSNKKYVNKRKGRGGLYEELPLTTLSAGEIITICNTLSRKSGLDPAYKNGNVNLESNGFRLPTFEEWCHFSSGGSQTSYFFGDEPNDLFKYGLVASAFSANTRVMETRTLRPNAFGIFDVYGNAEEIVHGNNQELTVVGGSSWANSKECLPERKATFLRPSITIGVRLVRTIYQKEREKL